MYFLGMNIWCINSQIRYASTAEQKKIELNSADIHALGIGYVLAVSHVGAIVAPYVVQVWFLASD